VTRNDLVWLALIAIGATAFTVWCFWDDAAPAGLIMERNEVDMVCEDCT